MCLECKVKQSGQYHASPEAAAIVWNARKPLAATKRGPPVAYGAHRFGWWGYVWLTEDDVAAWIRRANQQIPDPATHWHGPVALFDDCEAPAADVVELVSKKPCPGEDMASS